METQKNVFYNVVLAISQVLFPLITFPYLARVLGPSHIGLLNFADSYARYFILVAAFGIPIYGVREIAKLQQNKEGLAKLLVEIFSINLIITVLLSIVFGASILYVNKLNIHQDLFSWSLIFFFIQIFILEWFFIGLNQFKFIALRFFFIRLIFIICVFVFIKTSNDYLTYMKMQVGLNILLGIINIRYVFKFISINNFSFKNINLVKHLKPLFLLFLTIFFISIYLQLDTVILGFLTDTESVGYYSSALKLNKLIIAVFAAISAAMFPSMMNAFHEGNMEKFNTMVEQCFYVILSIGLPSFILVTLCAPEIIYILFGSNFERAVLPLQITAPIILIVSMSTIFGFQILSALSKDAAILKSAIFGTFVSLVFTFLLVKQYKENGEALTILITELTVCSSFIYFSRKHFNIQHFSKILLHQIISIVPYIIIAFLFKYLIINEYIRVALIGLSSLLWFCILHLSILHESIFKKQFIKILNKYK